MAIVKEITAETIELMRGRIDFYMLRGILPVARSWPKKPKPPYTVLQATGMAVFSMAARSMKRLSNHITLVWQKNAEGKRSQWPDSYKRIAMMYWKKNRTFPEIALDYELVETSTTLQVVWHILKLYIDTQTPEDIYQAKSSEINKEEIRKTQDPIYITLRNNSGERLVSPYIKLEL